VPVQSTIDLQEQSPSEKTQGSSERYERWPGHGVSGEGDLKGLVQLTVAVVTAGAGLIHFAVVQEHWEEYQLFGLFFAASGSLQALWAFLVLYRPSRGLYGVIALASVAFILTWSLSRMVGLPIGPEKWVQEDARFIDVLCTEFEVVGLIGALILMRPELIQRRIRAWVLSLISIAVAASVAWTTMAAVGSAHHHM
jgi:hypothetical protein